MFDFDHLPRNDPLRTAYGRYEDRKDTWETLVGDWTWRVRHHFWWILHNCVLHPLIGVFPTKRFMDWHDWSSKRLAAEHHLKDAFGNPIPIDD